MLSQELANHSDRVLGWAIKGPPDTQALIQLSHVLLDLSQQARQLERLPVDDADLVMQDDD